MSYGFTIQQYTAALKAFAAGVTSVTVEGRTVEYYDRDEMWRNIQLMKEDLEGQGLLPGQTPLRAYRITYRKGL